MNNSFSLYCRELDRHLAGDKGESEAIKIVFSEVKGLLRDPSFLLPILTGMAEGKMNGEQKATDYNDITLYRNPRGLYSVRLFVWESFVPYPVHDHGAWGVVAGISGQVKETKYRRVDNDDSEDENTAVLEINREAVLTPGAMTAVLPLDRGIHHMEPLNGKTALTLHTYGAPVRKGYIRGFVPERKTAYRIYAPKYGSRVIGLKALSSLNIAETVKTINRLSGNGHPLILEEARRLLEMN